VIDERTIPKLLIQAYHKYGDKKVALRKKSLGVWKEYTWNDVYTNVKYFSLGLISLGFKRGDVLAILGDNDPEWYFGEWAAQAVGGIATGIFVDCLPIEVEYLITHCGARIVMTEDQEQVDKILSLKEKGLNVDYIIYWDRRGMWGYDHTFLTDYRNVIEMGEKYEREYLGKFEQLVQMGKSEDIAAICYTSGTSGVPKGAMLSHRALILSAEGTARDFQWGDNTNYAAFMPPGWILDQVNGIAAIAVCNNIINFVEEPETAPADMRELGPEFVFYGARHWENLASTTLTKMSDASLFRKFTYELLLPVGYKMSDFTLAQQAPSPMWRALWRFADLLVFHPLRDKLGLSRVRIPGTGGTYLGPNIIKYFAAIGLPIRTGYGLTESPSHCVQTSNTSLKPGCAGIPGLNREIRITEDGEILLRGPALFSGYWKDAEGTANALKDGWFHTGDAGAIEQEGQLVYFERVADVLTMKGGVILSPTFIESRLKFSPYIKDAMVFGGETRAFASALININFEVVAKWAEKRHIPFTSYLDLSQRPEVYDLIGSEIVSNTTVIAKEAGVQRFVNLHKEFDPDEGELTRTRKLRRKLMQERYSVIVEAIYEGKKNASFESDIRYQDGKTKRIHVNLEIRTIGGLKD